MKADTARRVRFAHGYLGLGLIADAIAELARINAAESELPEVCLARIAAHEAAGDWENLWVSARPLTNTHPEIERGWTAAAYALREMGLIKDAKEFLFCARWKHGHASALLLYNLACYYALLGFSQEAVSHLTEALNLAPDMKEDALRDRDLESIRNEIPKL